MLSMLVKYSLMVATAVLLPSVIRKEKRTPRAPVKKVVINRYY
jgi:hypothetical protein